MASGRYNRVCLDYVLCFRPLNGRTGLAALPQHMIANNAEREKAQQQAAEATFREPEDAYLSQLFHQVAMLLEQRIPGVG